MTASLDWSWMRALPLDRQEVAALVPLFKAGAECAQRWGWTEAKFIRLARVCWRWLATGKIEEPATDPVYERLHAFLAPDDPWPTVDVLRKLTDAGEHLLRDHDCDAHGYEEIANAVRVARQRLRALEGDR